MIDVRSGGRRDDIMVDNNDIVVDKNDTVNNILKACTSV